MLHSLEALWAELWLSWQSTGECVSPTNCCEQETLLRDNNYSKFMIKVFLL